MESTVSLTDEQIAFFHREGYLALDALVPPEELERMVGVYDRIFAERAGREEGNQFDLAGTDEDDAQAALPQILNPFKYAPELKEGQYRANALHIVQQLLGDDANFQGEHAIFKPARYGAATPWHQDEAYWNPNLNYHSVSVWIPLQPATLENGCMQFIPRSHLLEVQPHHTIGNDPRIHGLEIDELDASAAVACPLPAGGCTIHPSRTMHYTGANRSDIPRRALILGFGTPPKPRTADQPTRIFTWNDTKQTPREQRRQAAEKRAKAN
jgi:ectoine hydroxylase-related dioxygenase (phytanoyl-CoA dioxygenase family)